MTVLPAKLALLYAALPLETDVAIVTLHNTLFPQHADRDPTFMQNCLGPYITKLNRRLDGQAVKPGLLRKTYRLVTI